jgi:hypothetical protein
MNENLKKLLDEYDRLTDEARGLVHAMAQLPDASYREPHRTELSQNDKRRTAIIEQIYDHKSGDTAGVVLR